MTYATLAGDQYPAVGSIAKPATGSKPDRRMFHSRLIAALYLTGFLFYGTGTALIASVVGAPDFLATIGEHRAMIALGAVLMLLPIITDVWRAVVFFPILGNQGRSTALTYFGAQIISVAMFFFGVLSLLLLVPFGEHAMVATGATPEWATAIGALLVQSNEYAFQISQIALAFGSLSLWAFGFRVGLIPRAFAAWGLVGYVFLMAGCIAELFGLRIGMWMLIPGALFEIALPVWLLIKGFSPAGYARD